MQPPQPTLCPNLGTYVDEAQAEPEAIAAEHKAELEQLARFIQERRRAGETAALVFICSHNSRRSLIAQIWAQTAAHCFSVPGVQAYSGGTEATAFNSRAVAAIERAGFLVEDLGEGDNPVYRVRFAEGGDSIECFSKLYSDPPNPKEGFAAIMICAAADAACPIVSGSAARISLPFDDPGEVDGMPFEQEKYDECSRQIAREMFFALSLVRR